jgi:hypothetical protein
LAAGAVEGQTMTARASRADTDKEVPDLPYVLRPRGLRATLTALLSAAAVLAVPAAAQAACPAAPTTKAFQAFGDTSDYSLLTNGAFETGSGGWSLTGAWVTFGNESYKVHAATDARSLAISPTGNVVSPAFCVSTANPSFRLFAKRTSGTWGVLNVKLRWTDNGQTNETVVGSVSAADTSWHPTQVFSLSSVLGLWSDDQAVAAQIVLDPEDYGGAWAIDDVYVDPYVRG